MTTTPEPSEPETAHEAAITDGEVHQIIVALRPFGILDRDALAKACSQHGWQDGGFETALRKAVSTGVVTELPGGFFKLVQG